MCQHTTEPKISKTKVYKFCNLKYTLKMPNFATFYIGFSLD